MLMFRIAYYGILPLNSLRVKNLSNIVLCSTAHVQYSTYSTVLRLFSLLISITLNLWHHLHYRHHITRPSPQCNREHWPVRTFSRPTSSSIFGVSFLFFSPQLSWCKKDEFGPDLRAAFVWRVASILMSVKVSNRPKKRGWGLGRVDGTAGGRHQGQRGSFFVCRTSPLSPHN